MSKKFKFILISVTLMVVTLIFNNISLAWSPANQSPIYPQAGGYFCMQKDGAVRFTVDGYDASYYYPRYDSSEHPYEWWECHCDECLDGLPEGTLEWEELCGNEDLQRMYDAISEDTRPIPSNSEKLKDYNGDFTERK